MKFLRNDTHITFCGMRPTDRNDPAGAKSAVELALPTGFSKKAKTCWNYFDGAAFIFAYKGRLVVTDESLWLTEYGDGTPGSPFGCPRWEVDSWEELEAILEEVWDSIKDDVT